MDTVWTNIIIADLQQGTWLLQHYALHADLEAAMQSMKVS